MLVHMDPYWSYEWVPWAQGSGGTWTRGPDMVTLARGPGPGDSSPGTRARRTEVVDMTITRCPFPNCIFSKSGNSIVLEVPQIGICPLFQYTISWSLRLYQVAFWLDLSAWEMQSVGAFAGTVGMDSSETPMFHYSACMEAYEYVFWQVLTQQFLGMLE